MLILFFWEKKKFYLQKIKSSVRETSHEMSHLLNSISIGSLNAVSVNKEIEGTTQGENEGPAATSSLKMVGCFMKSDGT